MSSALWLSCVVVVNADVVVIGLLAALRKRDVANAL